MALNNSFYNTIIKKNPLLTHQQEIKLSKLAKSGDVNARNKLIESNFRLVISIARKYHRSNFDLDDLIQESSTGLIKAVDKFEPDMGYKFSTYASWWIKQAALSYINEKEGTFKVPTHSRLLNYKIKNIINDYEIENERKPTEKEISEISGESIKKIKYTLAANKSSLSFDKDPKDENAVSLKDKVEEDSIYFNPETAYEAEELHSIIEQSLKCLTAKEEKIIRLRFGLTLENDIDKFPVTKEMKEYLNEK